MGSVRFRADREIWFIDYMAADGRRIREVIVKEKRRAEVWERDSSGQLDVEMRL